MDAATSFFQHWYYHVPNYILAILLYACIGRFILSLFAPAGWDHFIWKGFVRVSDPAVKTAAYLAPAAVPPPVTVVFAILWLIALRVFLFIEFTRWGLAPAITG